MASQGDEIDNCGFFLEHRRHIFCGGKLSAQQSEHARILPAKVQLLNFQGYPDGMQIFLPWAVSKPFTGAILYSPRRI